MKRRDFLAASALWLTSVNSKSATMPLPSGQSRVSPVSLLTPIVMTVRGKVDARELGTTLMHEHILVDFIGADKASKNRYKHVEVVRAALPHLQRAAQLGCRTIVDCTPAYIGRDAALLKDLSEQTKLHIITTTGYYAAANDKFVPAHAYQESAEQLAQRWTNEFEQGIENTNVRPGIIKIGVDRAPLSDIDRKLVQAAALTHRRTGLTIGAHTGDGRAAFEQLDVLSEHGVAPQAFIWMHAQNESNQELHLEAARRGCWIEFDGINSKSAERHAELVNLMSDKGFLNQTLVSMDAGWYKPGEPGGGNFRGYDSLFREFLPVLERKLIAAQVKQLLITNPQQALAVNVKAKQ